MAAIMIEDQVWPKRCGHMAGKSVIPAEEMVQKIKAAADARSDSTFVIKARTACGCATRPRRGNSAPEYDPRKPALTACSPTRCPRKPISKKLRAVLANRFRSIWG